IPVDKLDADEAAKRIRQQIIAVELAAVLHDWAIWRRGSPPREGKSWQHFLALARAVDRDEWRTRLRGAIQKKDRENLEEMAAEDAALSLPVVSQILLADALRQHGTVEKWAAFLRKAQREHPDQFWLNFYLARCLHHRTKPPQMDEAIRFYTAALTVRPRDATMYVNLADAILDKGDPDEAIVVLRKATRLDPDHFLAHLNLGYALDDKELYDEGARAFKEAIRIRPKDSHVHSNLGATLAKQKKF